MPSILVHVGPAMIQLKSITRMPSNGNLFIKVILECNLHNVK